MIGNKLYLKRIERTRRVYSEWLDDAIFYDDLKTACDLVRGEERVVNLARAPRDCQ